MERPFSDADFTAVHKPVLLEEVLSMLAPKKEARILDGTLGLAGHAKALLELAGDEAKLLGLDRDEAALAYAKERLKSFGERVAFCHCPFSEVDKALDDCGWDFIDTALIDIGVSSLQLDEAERGFSFLQDAPLDMRMDRSQGHKGLWTFVNTARFETIKEIIAKYGEDPQAGRIARHIINSREKMPINTTLELANIVSQAYPAAWRAKARNHPATRTFQAFRMHINDELGELSAFLSSIIQRLHIGGRLGVITFHSIEDRIVKHSMRDLAKDCICPRHIPFCKCKNKAQVKILTKKPIGPSPEEERDNPRSRSAKLRVIEKIAHKSQKTKEG